MSVRLRAAPLSSPLETCRSCAIKIKPGSSQSSGAQTQQPQVSTLLGETQGRLCQEERGFLGTSWGSAYSGLWHGPPNSPKNSPHLRKRKNVWGQSKRKMFQGRASSAGRCGASVIGGTWEVHAASQERRCKWRGRISPFWKKAKWEKWVDVMLLL